MSIEKAILDRLRESKVGAFYIVGGKIVSNDINVRDGDSYGDFVNYSSHWDLWRAFQRMKPSFKSVEYDEFPRGRVVFDKKKNKYIIYLDPKLNTLKYLGIIRAQYGLRGGSYIPNTQDEHYKSKRSPEDMPIKEGLVFTKHLSHYIDTDTI